MGKMQEELNDLPPDKFTESESQLLEASPKKRKVSRDQLPPRRVDEPDSLLANVAVPVVLLPFFILHSNYVSLLRPTPRKKT